MIFHKKISALLIVLDLLLILYSYAAMWGNSEVLISYPMSIAIQPYYDFGCKFVGYACLISIWLLPMLIIVYNLKKPFWSNIALAVCIVMFLFAFFVTIVQMIFYKDAQSNYNPLTVQSVMIEINLEQLSEMQNSEERTMIYFGRPTCGECETIKTNLDILVNNSHSTVYYYNTEQDRASRPEEMKMVLDVYGIASVPALAVLEAGEVQTTYFDDDIIDYFLNSGEFVYQ